MIHVALFSVLSLSAHRGGGRERGRRADAGGDLRPHPAHHRSGEPAGRHRPGEPAGKTTGPLRLLGRVLGRNQRGSQRHRSGGALTQPMMWLLPPGGADGAGEDQQWRFLLQRWDRPHVFAVAALRRCR